VTQKLKILKEKNIEVETFNAHLLNEPWEVQNNSGLYFKVFTPYWRKAFDVYNQKNIKLDITKINPIRASRKICNGIFYLQKMVSKIF
jgi:deoxyribodipyrimidine photolyase